MSFLSRIGRSFLPAFLVVALCLPLCLPTPLHAEAPQKKEEESPDAHDTYKYLSLFSDVMERVRADYVDPVSDEKLVETALNGMLSSLDPHSGYLNKKSFSEMQTQTRGEFGGLGIEVTMEDGIVKVVSPIDDTPAARAGLQPGDLITHIEDKPVTEYSLSEAVDKMRGAPGTKIRLTIRRGGLAGKPFDVSITRAIIKIKSVKYEVKDDSVGYIRITTFNEQTQGGLDYAIDQIKAKAGDKLLGYVLDLRNNPGGLLDQAISVSSTFLPAGEPVVSTRGRHVEDNQSFLSRGGDKTAGLPMVVIVNNGSASASEIVSGALQDYKRAIIIGTKSFGKGSVQTIIPLQNGGAMRLTTARYYTPSGRSIQAEGIQPDIVVQPAKVEEIKSAKLLHEADLRGALTNDTLKKDNATAIKPKDAKPAEKKHDADAPAVEIDESAPTPSDDAADDSDSKDAKDTKEGDGSSAKASKEKPFDYQMARAVDLLRGISLYEKQRNEKSAKPVPAASPATPAATDPSK